MNSHEAWQKEISLPPASQPAFSSQPEEMFFTRMLYSCLVDADFLDTEAFMAGKEQGRGGGSAAGHPGQYGQDSSSITLPL